ncbi:L-2-hydroxyglutarate oxidase [Agromyces ramosus]|uniref:L-2-hydroxyglutarate oxidase n=2 Tax=Agromyces ramosus TaxID=33879 RepID=A0ABU0RBG0_9MICO|nr:L-2-hydroxyglutarate oxidase [Agromyces ramosus]MDQ0895412.1 L-2-hydroxyglutarate oxidase [Agromyces ramosus]
MPKHVIIVGGGIVGLAVAERASRQGHRVTVLEKEAGWAMHQTGRNSGVIHAGPYYRPGSLKAELCTAGNRSMKKFATEQGIPWELTGKLIVATTDKELPALAELRRRSEANNVPFRLLDAEGARSYEPHVAAVAALRIESTGIIDYGAVSRRLAEMVASRGGDLRLSTAVVGIASRADRVIVSTADEEFSGDLLVNCAGLHSDKIARMAGLAPSARIIPFRGEYHELVPERRHLVRGLIYPVPDPELPFLGVHLTRMMDGSVHAGPNAVTALAREGYSWRDIRPSEALGDLAFPGFLRMASNNVGVGFGEVRRSLSQSLFAKSLAKLVPGITKADLVPAKAGVRAQAIRRDGALVDDFLIERTPNQIHVLNAPSPAATASLEIAARIVELAQLD